MKNNICKLLSVGIVATLFASCGTDLEKTDYNSGYDSSLLPEVQTGEIIINSGNTAVTAMTVANKSNIEVKEQGVLYSTNSSLNLMSANIVRSSLESNGSAKVIMENIKPGTVYHYRAYAYTSEGISYGAIKQFTASSQIWDREMDYATDFDSEDCIKDFTPIKLAGKGNPWVAVPVSVQGLPNYMIASSALNIPNLFLGKIVDTGDADNLLQYAADFTGKILPAVGIYAIDVDGFLVGANRNSSIEVLVSPTPITSAAEADAAEKIGSVSFSAKEFQASVEYLLPAKYSNAKCYIAIRNKATYAKSLGVLLGEFTTSSLVEPGK